MTNVFIGVDPGVSGGIASVDRDGAPLKWIKMPATNADVLEALHEVGCGNPNRRAMLEFVRSSPQMGVKSAFTFGCGYGGVRMGLVACGIPFEEVTPLRWQRALGCQTKGDKNVSKAKAQELFPSVKVTHAFADALLIAEYARRHSVGYAMKHTDSDGLF